MDPLPVAVLPVQLTTSHLPGVLVYLLRVIVRAVPWELQQTLQLHKQAVIVSYHFAGGKYFFYLHDLKGNREGK